jgi:predicted Holliday junction resolvase-like endonuclease
MKIALALAMAALVSGCAIGTVASTAIDVVTLPVKVVSKSVDLATTSQAEADQKRGRELRKEDERRAREWRAMEKRCRDGRAVAGDMCSASRAR